MKLQISHWLYPWNPQTVQHSFHSETFMIVHSFYSEFLQWRQKQCYCQDHWRWTLFFFLHFILFLFSFFFYFLFLEQTWVRVDWSRHHISHNLTVKSQDWSRDIGERSRRFWNKVMSYNMDNTCWPHVIHMVFRIGCTVVSTDHE